MPLSKTFEAESSTSNLSRCNFLGFKPSDLRYLATRPIVRKLTDSYAKPLKVQL